MSPPVVTPNLSYRILAHREANDCLTRGRTAAPSAGELAAVWARGPLIEARTLRNDPVGKYGSAGTAAVGAMQGEGPAA